MKYSRFDTEPGPNHRRIDFEKENRDSLSVDPEELTIDHKVFAKQIVRVLDQMGADSLEFTIRSDSGELICFAVSQVGPIYTTKEPLGKTIKQASDRKIGSAKEETPMLEEPFIEEDGQPPMSGDDFSF